MKKFMLFLFLVLLSCSQGGDVTNMNNITESKKIDSTDINKLSLKKIYFGHQSVGYNILDGLAALAPDDSGLIIKETSDPKNFSKPVFAHSQNGENCKPETKINSFIQKMDAGLGNKVDIALFKFCYVDVTAETDVFRLFTEYKAAINGLIKKYPKTKFLHITVPLTVEDKGLKNRIKILIKSLAGRKTGHEYDNIKRVEYNELIKKEYGTGVFDLAGLESSLENTDSKNTTSRPSLLKQYTDDGGHLNQKGSKLIASRLVLFFNNSDTEH